MLNMPTKREQIAFIVDFSIAATNLNTVQMDALLSTDKEKKMLYNDGNGLNILNYIGMKGDRRICRFVAGYFDDKEAVRVEFAKGAAFVCNEAFMISLLSEYHDNFLRNQALLAVAEYAAQNNKVSSVETLLKEMHSFYYYLVAAAAAAKGHEEIVDRILQRSPTKEQIGYIGFCAKQGGFYDLACKCFTLADGTRPDPTLIFSNIAPTAISTPSIENEALKDNAPRNEKKASW
jgi:hypothetical protein